MATPFTAQFLSTALGFPQPIILNEAFQQWIADPNIFVGRRLMPEEPYYDSEIVAYDVLGTMQGMTHATTLGAGPQIISMPSRYVKYLPTQYWSETLRFDESDFLRIRRAGSVNQLAGMDEIIRGTRFLDLRLATRMEYNTWQALFGSLTIDDGGITRIVDYGIPATNQIVIGTTSGYGATWNNVSTADPVGDIQRASEVLFGKSDSPPDLWINGYDIKLLAQNAILRDLLKQSMYSLTLGRDAIEQVFPKLVGSVGTINVYRAGFISSATGLFQPFIPSGNVLMTAAPPMGQKLAAYRSTPNVVNGGAGNPQPGKFVIVQDDTNKIEKQYLINVGFYGVPCVFFPECLVPIQIY